MIFLAEDKSPIRKVTIEKMYLGKVEGSICCRRRYHVIYSSGFKRTFDIPTDKILKFIEENKREMSKVAFIFTDRS